MLSNQGDLQNAPVLRPLAEEGRLLQDGQSTSPGGQQIEDLHDDEIVKVDGLGLVGSFGKEVRVHIDIAAAKMDKLQ